MRLLEAHRISGITKFNDDSNRIMKIPAFKPPNPRNRLPVLIAARNAKMATSAHAYVRGNTLQFYEWLDSIAEGTLPSGPPIWICGDCHVGNLGPLANSSGKVEIEIRDFDQTVIGNPAHDLVRLGLSLAMAARGSDLPGVTTARMMDLLTQGYIDAFSSVRKQPPFDRPEVMSSALKESKRRTWRHLAEERVKGSTAQVPLGRRFWSVLKSERKAVIELVSSPEVQSFIARLGRRDDDARVEFLDVAYWLKGCSSLGRLRYAVLLDVGRDVERGQDFCLLDIKEAVKAVAPAYSGVSAPKDNAVRVLEGAHHLSPFLGDRMAAGKLMNRSVFIRELLPQDLKLEIKILDSAQAARCAYYLARVVGRSHARQMDDQTRKQWRTELLKGRSKSLGAPSWLWSSVVDLVASHERGYLEHCRRFALDEAFA